jgi:sulfate adenylyltransferase subunit 2
LVHIDTGHNFDETIQFRDQLIKDLGEELVVGYVQDAIDNKKVKEQSGKYASRNSLQTYTLLETIEKHQFDACIGGARRDEEKARAKERIFSVRDDFGQWQPKKQRPELWDIYNGKINKGENVRVFPISNWTELDVWNYIKREGIAIPSIYYAHERECIIRDGQLMANSPHINLDVNDTFTKQTVRFRTVGDITCTAAVSSTASTIDEVIEEIKASRITERGLRIDDQQSEAAMEDRKKVGYF